MRNRDLYDHDIITIKQFGDHTVKATYTSATRIPGVEDDRQKSRKRSVNDQKLSNNLARARSKVKEYVLCNPWDYWCTFTISPQKYDRYNLKGYIADLGEFIHNYNRRCDSEEKVKYLLIPEMHKDGAWHMHGFLKGIRKGDIYKNQYGYMTWRQYEEHFGFISMDPVRDIDRCSSYMTKYMTKEIGNTVTDLEANLYYHSKGLQTAQTIYKGHAQLHCDWDWEHPDGYCKIKTFDTRKDDISEYIEVMP